MSLQVYVGKTIEKNIELSPINVLEPDSHEKGRVPILNQLRPKEIFERNCCASGWSDIYDHSTNPAKSIYLVRLSHLPNTLTLPS